MGKNNYKKILETIAKNEGISVEEVEREMQIAILSGYRNPDPQVQKIWSELPFKGEYPTPEEIIPYLAKLVKN